jgi:hypothetical protein
LNVTPVPESPAALVDIQVPMSRSVGVVAASPPHAEKNRIPTTQIAPVRMIISDRR